MAEMTPLEAAEIILNPHGYGTSERNAAECLADSYLRAIAAGEYKPVVHGRWERVDDGVSIGNGTHLECSNCHVWSKSKYMYCRCCGAKMESRDGNSLNGKEETHE